MCKGGTNVVDLDPDPEPEPLLDCLLSREVIDRIVLIDPVGDRVSDWSGMVMDRSSASLYPNNQSINIRTPPKNNQKKRKDSPNSTNPSNPLPRTLRRKPLNSIPIK